MNLNSKILITGSRGLLGSALVDELLKKKYKKILKPSSVTLNLLDLKKTIQYFKKNKPIYIFHMANKVYGIGGNSLAKFEMLNDNLIINSNLLKACSEIKIKKVLCVGSSAIYNSSLKNNIKENQCFYKEPHVSEYDYSFSKRIMLKQLQLLYRKNKIDFSYVILNNLYGKNDNFDTLKGHVVPSIIHKTYLANKKNIDLILWGSGNEKRCLMNSKDAARALELIMKSNEKVINLSSNREYKINELSRLISKEFNFNNKTIWKKTFASVKRRHLNIDLISKKLKFKEYYSLEAGLKETIEWFLKNYKKIRK